MKIVLFVTLGMIMLSTGCVGAKPVHPPVQNSNITSSNISGNTTPNPWPNAQMFAVTAVPINVSVGQQFVIKFNQFTSSNVDFQPANVVVVESKQFVQNPGVTIPDGTTWILFKAVAAGNTKVSVTETTRFGDPLQTKTFTINVGPAAPNVVPNQSVTNASPVITLPPQGIKYTLKVLIDPPGAGSVSPTMGAYDAGTSVTLIATPAMGYKVLGWNIFNKTGVGGTGGSTSYTTGINSNTIILVSFTPSTNTNPVVSTIPHTANQTAYPLEVVVDPPWAGSVSPATGTYDAGTNVTLIATPASGYVLSYWNVANSGGYSYGGNDSKLNTVMNSITIVSVHFVASPSIWDKASFYNQSHRTFAPGEYFIIAQDFIAGQFGVESLGATYDESLVALIDRKGAVGVSSGPITPGMHSATAWLLFKALKPGAGVISVAQVRGSYVEPPKTYSVTIGN